MTRKLKVLGIAMVAVFAMSAVMASAASAGAFTSTGPTVLKAVEKEATLTAFGLKVVCEPDYEVGIVGETPHKKGLPSGSTTFTITPVYTACNSFIGETKAPSTVTMNGCDFVLHIGALISGTKYKGTADVVCPAGKEIEVHAYTSVAHSSTVCTVKIPAQAGLENGTVESTGGVLKLAGPVKGIKATKTGILCGGAGETTTGEQDLNATVTGTTEGGAATSVSLSGA